MTTYSVTPDGEGTPALWRAESEHDQYPIALAYLSGNESHTTDHLDHGVVFRAAAAVLAPSDPLVIAIAKALQEEVDGAPWDEQDIAFRDGWYGAAYRALETLRAYAEEATP